MATVLALSGGLLVAPAAVAADAPAIVVDDFLGAPLGSRVIGGSGSSVTVTPGAARIAIGAGGGVPYAEIVWDLPAPVDLTRGGALTQLQLDYSGAGGNTSSNPVSMGIYLTDANGKDRSRGGTGLLAGSGKFVANFVQQGPDDVRYLTGTGDLTRITQVKIQLLAPSNGQSAAITLEWLAAVALESAYTLPSFTGPTTVDLRLGTAMSPVTVTAAGYPRPTVTTSGALPTGVVATASGTSVTLSGTPSATGMFTFRVSAKTLDDLVGYQDVTLRVFTPPTVTGPGTVVATVGAPVTHTLDLGGSPLPTVASADPPLPPGLTATVAGAMLVIAGTPTGPGGTTSTTLTVDNGYATATLPVTVRVEAPATMTGQPDLRTEVGTAVAPIALVAGGYPAPTVTLSGLPAGLVSSTTATGVVISGTPTSTGSTTITATAANGVGAPAGTTFQLVVGTPPTIDVPAQQVLLVGSPVAVPVTVTGYPSPVVTATGLPAGLALSGADGAWSITGTPTRDGLGVRTVTLTATNGIGAGAAASTVLTIEGAPSVSGAHTLTATRGTPLAAGTGFAVTGYPVPVLGLVATDGGALPPGILATDDGAGRLVLSGTPTEAGTWDLTVTASSSRGSTTHLVAVTVGAVPEFTAEARTVRLGANSYIATQLTATSYPSHTVTIVSGTLPSGLTLGTDGMLRGSTGSAAAGRHELIVQASNAFGSDTLALSIDVLTRPDIPAGLPDLIATADSAVTYTFTTSGWTPPTVTLLDPLPAGLALSRVDATTWQITGTVTRENRGARAVRLSLDHGNGSAVVRYLDVVVKAALRWTSPSSSVVVERGVPMAPFPISLTGFPVPGGLISNAVNNLGLTRGTWTSTEFSGWITGTPPASGTWTYWICPARGNICDGPTLSTRVIVQDRPVITVAGSVTVAAGQPVDVPVTVTGSPVAGLSASGLPSGLTLVPTGAPTGWSIVGTTDRSVLGSHPVTLTADNGLVRTKTVTVTVTGPPELDGPATVAALRGTPLSVAFTATGGPTPTLTAATADSSPWPAGLVAADDGHGVLTLSGSPTARGTWSLLVTASNEHGTDTSTVALTVDGAPLFVEDAATVTVREGVPVTRTFAADASPVHQVAVVAGALPAGLSLSTDGVLTGTLSAGAAAAASGTTNLTLRAWNLHGADLMDLSLVLEAPPSVTGAPVPITALAGTAGATTFVTAGWPAPTVTLIDPLPAGLDLVRGGPATWSVAGTPGRADRGLRDVRILLDNGIGSPVVAHLALRVDADLQWEQVPATLVLETGVPIEPLRVRLTGYPMPGGYLLPTVPWLDLDLAEVSWLPTAFSATFVGTPPSPGVSLMTLTPTTAGAPPLTVELRVADRPVLGAPASVSAPAGLPMSLDVTVAASPDATVTATGLPDGVSLEPGPDAGLWRITGTPGRDVRGEHVVTLTADNGLTSTHHLALTITAGPVLAAPSPSVTAWFGDPVAPVSWTATGYPAPTVELVGDLPSGVVATGGPAGSALSGTPTESGSWDLVVRAVNAHGTAEADVTLVVTEAPAFGSAAVAVPMTEGVASSTALTLRGFPFPTLEVAGSVAGLTLAYTPGGDPVLTGTPAAGAAGDHTLTVTARSIIGGDPFEAVTVIDVHVEARSTLPATLEPLTVLTGEPVDREISVAGAPAPTVTATGLPDGLRMAQVEDGSWHLTGVPAPGTGGVHTATVTAANGVLEPASVPLTVTVHEPATLAVTMPALREGEPATVGVRTVSGWPAAPRLTLDGALPTGLSFADAGDGTATITGTPAVGSAWAWPVTVVADNGAGTPTRQVLTLMVAPAKVSPATVVAPETGPGPVPAPAGSPTTPAARGSDRPAPAVRRAPGASAAAPATEPATGTTTTGGGAGESGSPGEGDAGQGTGSGSDDGAGDPADAGNGGQTAGPMPDAGDGSGPTAVDTAPADAVDSRWWLLALVAVLVVGGAGARIWRTRARQS